jgi:hypothetical protein
MSPSCSAHWAQARGVLAILQATLEVTPFPLPDCHYSKASAPVSCHRQKAGTLALLVLLVTPSQINRLADVVPSMAQQVQHPAPQASSYLLS